MFYFDDVLELFVSSSATSIKCLDVRPCIYIFSYCFEFLCAHVYKVKHLILSVLTGSQVCAPLPT